MDNEKINKLALIAIEDSKRAFSRLQEIQDCCRHKETNIEKINNILQLTCKTCYVVIGYPTKQQIIDAGFKI